MSVFRSNLFELADPLLTFESDFIANIKKESDSQLRLVLFCNISEITITF